MPQIRQALGIAGVATKTFAYQTDGAQVDMVTRAGGQDRVYVRDEVVGTFTGGASNVRRFPLLSLNRKVLA